jgi:hypothetical protein
MFTPCGEDPQGRCNLLRRATPLARYAYLSDMCATRPAVFRVTNRRLKPVSLPGKVLPVLGAAWTLLSLVASPGSVVPCSCASFCASYSSTTLEGGYTHYAAHDEGDMPRSLHYDRSAPHACHWHTGCTKRFSSKRQLFLHLGEEHGLQPDAETGGFRATGLGARARRRESRAALSRRSRPRSPVDQRFNALETSSLGETLMRPCLARLPRCRRRRRYSSRRLLQRRYCSRRLLQRRHAEFAELLQRRHAIKEFASTGSIPFLPFPPFLTLILICLTGTLFLRVHLLPAARSCWAEAAEMPPRVPLHLGPRLI